MAKEKRFAGLSRTAKQAALNLGVIMMPKAGPVVRSDRLAILDAYYDNTQYDNKINWEDASSCQTEDYIPVRNRKPRLIYAIAKVLAQRVASKLVGELSFPKLKVDDDPDTELFIESVLRLGKLRTELLEPVRRTLSSGSCFVRFQFVEGVLKVEHYLSKYCYPEFDEAGELLFVEVKYVYETDEKDAQGKIIKRWYKLELTRTSDILYDNPVYDQNSTEEPEFKVEETANHNLGYVQGEWFRNGTDKHKPDGASLHQDILTLIDDINYSMSQSSVAVSYNQDPQTVINGVEAEELDELIRSSAKAWNLGKEGKAAFLESDLGGVKTAMEFSDSTKQKIQDVTRVIMLDPEKIVGNAQSGKAMEVMHGPFVELVSELRPVIGSHLASLTLKIALTVLLLNAAGVQTGISIPQGYKPKSLDLTPKWAPVFPMTLTDLKEKVALAVAASTGNIIARKTATQFVAEDFGIQDIDAELAEIAAQPQFNPFGGGF